MKKRTIELETEKEILEKVVSINRVAKVVKGGRRFSLTAVVVVGDNNGKVGYGMGKAKEVPAAIRKAIFKAKKNMIDVSRKGTTIPYKVLGHYGAGKVMLKPAAPGTGIIAGGPVRAVMDMAGIKDILAKSLGSSNPINIIKATFAGLESIKDATVVAQARGLKVEDILPRRQTSDAGQQTTGVKKEKIEEKNKKPLEKKTKAKTEAKNKKQAVASADKKKKNKKEEKKGKGD